MRLLKRDRTSEIHVMKDFPINAIPEILPYAIFLHIWGDDEVLFKDQVGGIAKRKK